MRIPDFNGFVNEAKDIPDREDGVSLAGGLWVNYRAYGPWQVIDELKKQGITTLKQVYAMFDLPCPTKPGGVRDLAKWVEDNPQKINAVFARLYRGGGRKIGAGAYRPANYKPTSYKLDGE